MAENDNPNGLPEYRLFQYWDKDDIPEEVIENIDSWRSEDLFRHELFSKRSAREFIGLNFDASTLAAFDQCAVPAMQSDIFRYCALLRHGGVYADVQMHSQGRSREMLSASGDKGILFRRDNGNIANGFMFVKNENERLIELILEFAKKNIENRLSQNVWGVTGPGVLKRLLGSDEHRDIISGFRVLSEGEASEFFKMKRGMSYKKKPENWRFFKNDSARSIFND